MSAPSRRLRVALVAGEPSGDQLGFKLMRALARQTAGGVEFLGVGGEAMAAEGLKSLFPLADVAVMGVLPVLARLPTLLDRIRRDRGGDRRSAPRRARHHRQPRLHPPRRAPRPPRAAGPAGDRLRQPVGLGLAAGPGAGDARLCRLRAGAAAVRAGSARAARRPALRLRRPSSDRAARRVAAERRRRREARRDAAARPRPARLPPLGDRAIDGRFRRGDRRRRARGGPVRDRSADPAACRERRARARRALAGARRESSSARRRSSPPSAARARRSPPRARSRSSSRSPACRWSAPTRSRRSRRCCVLSSRCRSRSCSPTSCSAKRRFPNSCNATANRKRWRRRSPRLSRDGPARSAQLTALDKLDARMRLADGRAPSAHAAAAVLETIARRNSA